MDIIEELLQQLKKIEAKKENTIQMMLDYGFENYAEQLSNSHKKNMKLFDININALSDLKVAAIMDPFTLESYRPECSILELTPMQWKEQLEEFAPHMVFIESAWHGKDKLWFRKVDRYSRELDELSVYCNEKNIPIVFWNKEDPVHTSTFMITAALADFVFTTDIDCIKRYKTELGHDRVYHLHFAAQPIIHNPIDKYDRKDKFCFAGAYYHKYVKRAAVFDKFAKVFIENKGFDIFDRNYKNALPEYAFPEFYDKYILGNLQPSEIDVAYKGYNYGVNMNSVQNSQSMFARRVFELLASNTILVGNYSRGIKNYFGDLTISTEETETLENMLNKYCFNQETLHKYRLLGLRKVLSEHLYEDRLDYITETVFGVSLKKKQPLIVMLAKCANNKELKRILDIYQKQTYKNKKLVVIGDGLECQDKEIILYTNEEANCIVFDSLEGDYCAYIDAKDYYGGNYLNDMALTMRYGEFDGIGKNAYYSFTDGQFVLNDCQNIYKPCASLNLKRAMLSRRLLEQISLETICNDTQQWVSDKFISIDEFNYCENYTEELCEFVDDLFVCNQGVSLNEMNDIAEKIEGIEIDEGEQIIIKPEKMLSLKPTCKQIVFSKETSGIMLNSKLPEDKFEYIYLKEKFDISDIVKDGKIKVEFHTQGDLDCICVVVFFDKNGEKIQPQYPRPNILVELEVPDKAMYIQVGYRPKGTGLLQLGEVVLCNINTKDRGCFVTNKKTLILTNQYPEKEYLYRNMFVHKRVKSYQENQLLCEVMCMNNNLEEGFREFEGIDIVQGGAQTLSEILESDSIKTVCVHFLDREMWNILKLYLNRIKIVVWCHGADIQPWWRREYLYKSVEERKQGELLTKYKMDLWNEVFAKSENESVHFVFVSQYFANIVMEDYKYNFSKKQYSIIHNYIDSELFNYTDKNPDLRKRIISVRPYASEVYANDVMVSTIVELSKRRCFKDLDFFIAGDGKLFEKTTRPLLKYKNVLLNRGFYSQNELAEKYKEYGIVLIPSRGDTQGVSRDEAMSAGCVPITNPVMAIPEFVDDTCAFLVESENPIKMADAIEQLYNDEVMFKKMSEKAAMHVRKISSWSETIGREIEIINERE